jgi:hypothetical protein
MRSGTYFLRKAALIVTQLTTLSTAESTEYQFYSFPVYLMMGSTAQTV